MKIPVKAIIGNGFILAAIAVAGGAIYSCSTVAFMLYLAVLFYVVGTRVSH